MKRSDFLAIIPALSAIPLLGKNIVKTEGGIFIEKPLPIKIAQSLDGFNPWEIDVHLMYRGRKIGECFITQYNMHNDHIETSCADNEDAKILLTGNQSMTIEATLKGALEI